MKARGGHPSKNFWLIKTRGGHPFGLMQIPKNAKFEYRQDRQWFLKLSAWLAQNDITKEGQHACTK